jgi:BirA family biotin operon repressor/biotin-[acetyl-CoA-carboxylase] ligase
MAEPLEYRVLRLLSHREFRSGEALARSLGVTRATIWNAIQAAQRHGVAVHRVRGSGYRLADPIVWLDAAAINAALGPLAAVFDVRVADEVDSTSSRLLAGAYGAEPGTVLVAERQSAGRGRAGRPWHSSTGGGLTFSVLWRFAGGAAALGGASLAVAVALIRALGSLGVPEVQVKWPNDIVHSGCKLAGILIELRGDALGPTDAVIGVGVNVVLTRRAREEIDQPVIDLHALAGAVDRNALLAAMLRELHAVLRRFEADGFAALRDEWTRHHAYHGREVEIALPAGQRVSGLVQGVGPAGELLVQTGRGLRSFVSGELRLRAREVPRNAAA